MTASKMLSVVASQPAPPTSDLSLASLLGLLSKTLTWTSDLKIVTRQMRLLTSWKTASSGRSQGHHYLQRNIRAAGFSF